MLQTLRQRLTNRKSAASAAGLEAISWEAFLLDGRRMFQPNKINHIPTMLTKDSMPRGQFMAGTSGLLLSDVLRRHRVT